MHGVRGTLPISRLHHVKKATDISLFQKCSNDVMFISFKKKNSLLFYLSYIEFTNKNFMTKHESDKGCNHGPVI